MRHNSKEVGKIPPTQTERPGVEFPGFGPQGKNIFYKDHGSEIEIVGTGQRVKKSSLHVIDVPEYDVWNAKCDQEDPEDITKFYPSEDGKNIEGVANRNWSFEEKFPELKNKLVDPDCSHQGYKNNENWIAHWNVKKFCLSKQRVKEAIEKRLGLGEPENLVLALTALKKELGLE